MKIIFCGPPHSGKSVFIANLIDRLPTDAYTIIRACPDGEGNWSNNGNQNETNIVRKKGKFTKSFIEDSCKAIDNQTNKIVLVDVGGVMSKENEQVFSHCDSFLVLSSDEKKKKEWLEFGKKLGLECVGSIDSSFEGQEEIYSRMPYIQGKIVGLERGKILENSSVIKAIASDIVQKSRYAEKTEDTHKDFNGTIIDDTELGFELGYGKEIFTEDGIPIKKVRWKEEAIPQIYQAVQERVSPQKILKINGIRANFILCAICKAAKEQGVKDISAYDIRTKQYIPIKNLHKKKGLKQTEGLSYNIIENKESIFLDIDITKEQYSLEDYKSCVLPKISKNKNLYVSGRIPLWLLASISNSYDSNKIFTFQPGKGFTCISSKDEKELGTIVDGVEVININQYFEDKRVKSNTKHPSVMDRRSIISKIKGLVISLREKKEKEKYLDDKIIVKNVYEQENVEASKNSFQSELKKDISERSNPSEQMDLQHVSEQEVSKNDVGG